jgi:hypothetical protein
MSLHALRPCTRAIIDDFIIVGAQRWNEVERSRIRLCKLALAGQALVLGAHIGWPQILAEVFILDVGTREDNRLSGGWTI